VKGVDSERRELFAVLRLSMGQFQGQIRRRQAQRFTRRRHVIPSKWTGIQLFQQSSQLRVAAEIVEMTGIGYRSPAMQLGKCRPSLKTVDDVHSRARRAGDFSQKILKRFLASLALADSRRGSDQPYVGGATLKAKQTRRRSNAISAALAPT